MALNNINRSVDRIAQDADARYPSRTEASQGGHVGGSSGGTGNRCGHDPERLRPFAPPEQHRPRPKILQRAIERITRYFDEPDFLPTLNAANGSERQQRSERREACVSVLSTLLHYLDILTLRVIIPRDDGNVQGITMERIAELAGIGLRRAERAIHDVKAAGLVDVFPIAVELPDGDYMGAAAIRTIPASLFDVLGLGPWLRNERKKAYERQQRREKRETASAKARGHLDIIARGIEAKAKSALGAVSDLLNGKPKQPAPATPEPTLDVKLQAEILTSPEYQTLKQEHPDKTIRELVALHLDLYPRPRGPP